MDRKWYIGALNDGKFIIDCPPSPCGTDVPPDFGTPPSMVLNVVALTDEQAKAIVDAHNAAIEALASQPEGVPVGISLRFGMGAWIVNTGTHEGEPCVYIDDAPERGEVGERAPDVARGTTPRLRLLFPTKDQARQVADALVGAPQPPTAGGVTDWILRPLLDWALGTIDSLNDGPLTADEWDEDAALYQQARAALQAQAPEAPNLEQWERSSIEFLAAALRERGDDLSTDSASWLEKWLSRRPTTQAPDVGKFDFVDIANKAQAELGRGIYPSTVEAVLRIALAAQQGEGGES